MNTLFGAGGGGGGSQGLGLQLRVPTVSQLDLSSFEETEEAKHLARLGADSEIVLQLSLRNYEGPEWDKFAKVLAQYGYQVVRAWIMSGVIFVKCGRKGIGLPARGLERDGDAAVELAGETVALAIRAFRDKVLVGKRWEPQKGATLKTFFVGQCIFQFPNVFRRWVAEHDLPPPDLDRDVLATHLMEAPTQRIQPDRFVDLKRTIEDIPKDDPRVIDVLTKLDYTQAEIAEVMDTTVRAVSSKVYRRKHRGRR